MRGKTALILAILYGALIPTWGSAQQEHAPVKSETARFGDPTSTARIYQDYLYGVVKSIDSQGMVLEKTRFGIDQAFKFERKTKFIHNGKPSKRDDLNVGDKVWVDVKTDKKTGQLVARKVVTGLGATD